MAINLTNPVASSAQVFSTEQGFPAVGGSLFSAGMLLWCWAAFVRGRDFGDAASLGIVLVTLAILSVAILTLRARWQTLPTNVQSGIRAALWSLLLVGLFVPEYLTHRQVPVLRSALFLGVQAVLFTGLFRTFAKEDFRSLSERTARRLVIGLGAAYLAITSALSLWKLRVFGYVGQDIGYFMQCFYTTLHGQFFHSNMYHDLLYSQRVSSDFAAHNQVVLFAFLPFYAIHASATTILMVRNVSMALCVWPAYLIARRSFDTNAAVVATLGFILTPAVFYQNLYDFAPLSLAGFPLLFALYFFLEGRFTPFLIFLALTQLVREDLVFVTIGIGLLGLLWRRDWRWSVIPALFGVSWAVLSWKVIFPHYLNGSTSVVQGCFSYLGSSPGAMLSTMVHHPRLWLDHDTIAYLKQLITPTWLVLPFASPMAWIALPYAAINMLGENGGCNSAAIYRHYSLIPGVLLFVSLLVVNRWVVTKWSVLKSIPAQARNVAAWFLFAAAAASLIFVTGSAQFGDLRSQPWHEKAREVVRLIPERASAAVPRYMLPMMANRMELYQSLRLIEYHDPQPEYVILDTDWERQAATSQWRGEYEQIRNFIVSSPAYQLSYAKDGFEVYRLCTGCRATFPQIPTSGGGAHD